MPTQDLSVLNPEQISNIQVLSLNTRRLQESKLDLGDLTNEILKDYSRIMNKIIFDKYLDECSSNVIPVSLLLPPKILKKEIPYFALIKLERDRESRDFSEIFKDFSSNALITREEAVRALQQIRIECNKILEIPFFYFNIIHQMRIEDFKHQQDSSGTQAAYYLKGTWVNEIVKIVKTEISTTDKSWFNNAKEISRVTYEQGKLKRLLTCIKLMMQDVILTSTSTNYHKYVEMILLFIPEKTEIISIKTVKNEYANSSAGKKKHKQPLFSVDLNIKDFEFSYSIDPQAFINVILSIFDKFLEELQRVPDIEPKFTPDVQSFMRKDQYVKVPKRPKEKPLLPAAWDLSKLPDENEWIWDLYEKLRIKLQQILPSMDQYLKVYDQYKDILKIDPIQYVKDIDAEDPPRAVESLRDEILLMREKENKIIESIPEEIQVSFFIVNCYDLTKILSGKYSEIVDNLTNLIVKRAKDSTLSIYNTFNDIQMRIKEVPKNIEELTALNEFIENIPSFNIINNSYITI